MPIVMKAFSIRRTLFISILTLLLFTGCTSKPTLDPNIIQLPERNEDVKKAIVKNNSDEVVNENNSETSPQITLDKNTTLKEIPTSENTIKSTTENANKSHDNRKLSSNISQPKIAPDKDIDEIITIPKPKIHIRKKTAKKIKKEKKPTNKMVEIENSNTKSNNLIDPKVNEKYLNNIENNTSSIEQIPAENKIENSKILSNNNRDNSEDQLSPIKKGNNKVVEKKLAESPITEQQKEIFTPEEPLTKGKNHDVPKDEEEGSVQLLW